MTKRPAAVPVAWASAAAFLAVFAGLAFQMRQGRDPVLRAGHDGASAVVAPRRVLIRRVVTRRVIVRVIPAEPAAGGAPTGTATPSVPVVTSSPTTVAAAPAPAPAPASPPAPVTRTS
jgi:hypothetical protein